MSSQSSALFDDEPSRRLWLLRKALEAVPLKEALKLAQAALNFLDGAAPSDVNLAISPPDPGQWAAGLPHDAVPLAFAACLGGARAVPAIELAPLPSRAALADASDTQEAPYASTVGSSQVAHDIIGPRQHDKSFARAIEDRVASAVAAASRVEAEQVEEREMIYGAEVVAAE